MSEVSKLAIEYAARPYPYQMFKDEESDEEVMYLAKNPDLEGCMAQGATMKEALENLESARIDYIDFLLEQGLPVPEPSEIEPTLASVDLVKKSTQEINVEMPDDGLLYETSPLKVIVTNPKVDSPVSSLDLTKQLIAPM